MRDLGDFVYLLIVHSVVCISIYIDFSVGLVLRSPPGFTYSHTENSHVYFTNIRHTSKREKRSTEGGFPESFTVHFEVKDNPIALHLNKNSKISTNIPIYLRNKEGQDVYRHQPGWEQTRKHAFYQNKESIASFYAECIDSPKEDNCEQLELFGTFYIEEEFYIIESIQESTTNTSESFTSPYTVSQPVVPLSFVNDYKIVESSKYKTVPHNNGSRVRRATGRHTVELFVATDYSIFKLWFDASTANTNQGKKQDARNTIKTFVAFHINGIDVRYSSVNVGFTIDVTYAGLFIGETVSDSQWTESIKTPGNTVDVNFTLNNFNQWITNQVDSGGIPNHDHAMLFTRLDLVSNGDSNNIGYAFQGTMCTDHSQSIVEDKFNFIVETAAAHELGHSLGAKHDQVDNSCSASNHNIMAAVSSAQTGSIARNPWIFSSCSTSEIDGLLNKLNSDGNNCLLTTDSSTNIHELDSFRAKGIGQIYDINQQCEEIEGQGSFMCQQIYTDFEKVCTGLWCYNFGSLNCVLAIPADYTTCNDKKWCLNGFCVSSNDAPSRPSNCLYGDSKGTVVNNLTCSEMAVHSPWNCYTIASGCCVTCQQLLTGRADCKYGDQTNCSALEAGSSCYNNAELCCGTCEQYKTNIANCMYGDRADCSAITASAHCYSNAQVCCETCHTFKTTIPDCAYGDKVLDCKQSDCPFYSDATRNNCCRTCFEGTPPTTTPPPTVTTQPPFPTSQEPETTAAVATTGATTAAGTTNTVAPTVAAWVIPVAASAAGVLLLAILGCAICYCKHRSYKKPKAPDRGPSTISRNEYGRARSFTGVANVAYQAPSVPVTDYGYIPPHVVIGPRITPQRPPLPRPQPARPPPRRPPHHLPPIHTSTNVPRSPVDSEPHEYVEISDYERLQARQSTKSTTYETLQTPNNAQPHQQYTNEGFSKNIY